MVLIGTLDTKGVEYEFARNRFQKAGLKTIELLDIEILEIVPDNCGDNNG